MKALDKYNATLKDVYSHFGFIPDKTNQDWNCDKSALREGWGKANKYEQERDKLKDELKVAHQEIDYLRGDEIKKLREDLLQETGKCMKYQHEIATLKDELERLAGRDKVNEMLEEEVKELRETIKGRDKVINEYGVKGRELKEENERLKESKTRQLEAAASRHTEDVEELQSINRELVEALNPFEKLAHVVLDDNSFEGNRTLYSFDNAGITYNDLRNVLQALKNSTL